MFVALEGGDGAGKSTQLQLLTQALEHAGREVVLTRQPGGTPLGRQIRELVLRGEHVSPRGEALLYAADKAQHVDELIRPALERGADVITDRYTDSSIAYQGAGRELGPEEIHRLLDWAVDGLFPDLTVVLDVPVEVGRARRGDTHDRIEQESDDFHERVRQHFLDLADEAPGRHLVLDATAAPETLHAQIMAWLQQAGVLPMPAGAGQATAPVPPSAASGAGGAP